jgi:hypothetical protein
MQMWRGKYKVRLTCDSHFQGYTSTERVTPAHKVVKEEAAVSREEEGIYISTARDVGRGDHSLWRGRAHTITTLESQKKPS